VEERTAEQGQKTNVELLSDAEKGSGEGGSSAAEQREMGASRRNTSGSARRASGGRRTRRPSGTDIQEVEWQFDADELEAVEGWLREYDSGSGLSVVPGTTSELTDTYFDTEDWRLHRAGYALRLRRKGSNKTAEATMKSLASAGDGSEGNVRRREISERIRNADANISAVLEATGPVGERLRTLVGMREVRPLFEVQTHRESFKLRHKEPEDGTADGSVENDSVESRDGEDGSAGEIVEDASGNIRRAGSGASVGEVALDTTEIRFGDGAEPARLSRVEVEVEAEEAPAEVYTFVEEMRCSLGLLPTAISKYETGLFAAGLSPDGEPDLGPTDVDASKSVGEVALAVLRRQFAVMRTHEPGTRLGEDAEELHDMRVATRRLRAALKLFSSALPECSRWSREELRWIAGFLGEVRDLDVQIEQIQTLSSETEKEDRETLNDIVETMNERRVEARERMLESLNSARYERFVSSFSGMLRRGQEGEDSGEGLAHEPVTAVAPDLVSRRHRKWLKAGNRLADAPSPEDYHELRKEGKRLRYTLEFLTDVYGKKPVGKLVGPLKELQDGLGRHQDAIVAADLLEGLAADGGRRLSPLTAFKMGVLSERYLQEAADLRASLPRSKPYRVMTKDKAWKGFEKVMEKRHNSVEKARAKAGAKAEAGKKAKAKGGKKK